MEFVVRGHFFGAVGRGGLEMNHEKAYELHLSAANRGMPKAQYNTAVQLFEGKGVEQV